MTRSRGIVRDVRTAMSRRHRLAMFVGVAFGAFVPIAIYFTGHRAGFSWRSSAGGLMVGGLVYSVQTVYQSARQVFGQVTKAAGFVACSSGCLPSPREFA